MRRRTARSRRRAPRSSACAARASPFRGTPVMLVATDIGEPRAHTTRGRAVEGDPGRHVPARGRGRGGHRRRTTSRSTCGAARRATRSRSSRPRGVLRLPVAGIVRDYSDQQGAIMIDRSRLPRLLERRHGEHLPRLRRRRAPIRRRRARRILERFADERRLFVLTNQRGARLRSCAAHRPVVRPDLRCRLPWPSWWRSSASSTR